MKINKKLFDVKAYFLKKEKNEASIEKTIKTSLFSFEEKINNASDERVRSKLIEEYNTAATIIQKKYRQYRQLHPSHFNDFLIIRNTNGEIVGYKSIPLEKKYLKHPSVLKFKCQDDIKSGCHKILTHGLPSEPLVGLTMIADSNYGLNSSDQLVKNENEDHQKLTRERGEILSVFKANDIKYIVLQHPVTNSFVISHNLGENDLMSELMNNKYKFEFKHFKNFAKELDIFHSLNFAFRDIKPENMFYKEGSIYLTDLDFLGVIGSFGKKPAGTKEYFPIKLAIDSNGESRQDIYPYAIKQDQYMFLNVMMICFHRFLPEETTRKFSRDEIKKFLVRLNIYGPKRQSIENFLKNPIEYKIENLSMLFN